MQGLIRWELLDGATELSVVSGSKDPEPINMIVERKKLTRGQEARARIYADLFRRHQGSGPGTPEFAAEYERLLERALAHINPDEEFGEPAIAWHIPLAPEVTLILAQQTHAAVRGMGIGAKVEEGSSLKAASGSDWFYRSNPYAVKRYSHPGEMHVDGYPEITSIRFDEDVLVNLNAPGALERDLPPAYVMKIGAGSTVG